MTTKEINRFCIIPECNEPIQEGRPHGWTCAAHDIVERPFMIRRMQIEAKLKAERELEKEQFNNEQ